MAPPLYFFARKQLAEVVDQHADRFRPAVLAEHGLAETFSDVLSVGRQTATNELTQRGPGGFSGVITTVYAASGPDPSRPGGDIKRAGYHPDFQTWRKCGGSWRGEPLPSTPCPELWIGTDNESPPTPNDLLRRGAEHLGDGIMGPTHAGYYLTVGDGHRWCVPVIRRPPAVVAMGNPLTSLPMDMGWDEWGRFTETVKPQYQAIWDDTAALSELFFEPDGRIRRGEFEIGIEAGLCWALRVIGLNYRYGKHEQNLLHWIDRTNVFAVLGCAVDTPLAVKLVGEKKSDSIAEPVST